jgi:EAL and modified HD-GYP domain-containing signal transduction protein
MHNNLNLARQPILDRSENIIGYEFFYRDSYGECVIDDPRHATASVLVNLLNQIGSTSAFGETLAFINTDGPLLLTDILRTLPKEKFVFELSESTKITARIHEAIRHFHSLGYRFALDNASFNPHYLEAFIPLFPYIEFAKFDVTQTDIEQFSHAPNPYGQMKLIAQKVEFHEMAEAYEALGFEHFQGFYFAHAHLITQRRIDPQYMDVMELFTLLQDDAPMEEVCDSFKYQGILALQLFQFLRSAHPEYIEGAMSIKDIIERFGKSALMQWLLLIIYSKSGTRAIDEKNSHAVFAQNRIDRMVSLLEKCTPYPTENQLEEIQLIAMLSLLEGLMNVPMESLLQTLHPNREIEDALITHTGILGRIYAASLKLEKGDVNSASLLLKSYGITPEEISITSIR